MPSPSTGNLTPSLHCPKCMQPFRIPRDKVGALLRCKRCDLHFRVAHDRAGGYTVRKEGSTGAFPSAPRTIVPTRRPELPPTTAYPGAHHHHGADRGAAPPTIRPGESLSLNEDSTMLGDPIAPPSGRGREPASATAHRRYSRSRRPRPLAVRRPRRETASSSRCWRSSSSPAWACWRTCSSPGRETRPTPAPPPSASASTAASKSARLASSASASSTSRPTARSRKCCWTSWISTRNWPTCRAGPPTSTTAP